MTNKFLEIISKRLIEVIVVLFLLFFSVLYQYKLINAPIVIISILILANNILVAYFYNKKRSRYNQLEKLNELYSNVFQKYKEYEIIKELILARSPIGFILLDTKGKILYVNPAIGEILGSTETVGLNILEFDTVKKSRLYDGIMKAFEGISSEFRNENYVSYTTRVEKYINIIISPEFEYRTNVVKSVVIVIHDVTEEYRLKHKVEKNYINIIKALAELVDARDYYTGQHSKMVSKYTAMLCDKINFSCEEDIETIKVSAGFHDLGKIGVTDFILNKNGKLTEEEYNIMKKHSEIGADVLSNLDDFGNISKIIRHHHERWDGKGYPDGLKGEEIPLGSQIIAIADTYDAITSDRVYRKGKNKEAAIEILKEEKGKQFNPELVDKFIECIK